MLLDIVVLLIVFCFCFALLFLSCSETRPFFSDYLRITVGNGITTEKVVGNRFFVLKFLLQDTAIVIILFLLLSLPQIITWKKNGATLRPSPATLQYPIVLLMLTLAGTLPMIVTLKQRAFYLTTVYPFFCIAIGLLLQPITLPYVTHMSRKTRMAIRTLASLCLCTAIVLTFAFNGKITRNKNMIQDVQTVLTVLPQGQTAPIPPDMSYSHIAYLGRIGKIDYDMSDMQHPFLIATNKSLRNQLTYAVNTAKWIFPRSSITYTPRRSRSNGSRSHSPLVDSKPLPFACGQTKQHKRDGNAS